MASGRIRMIAPVAFLTLMLGVAPTLRAQPRTGPPDAPGPRAKREGAVTPAEIQRLFDAYVVMQSQEAVGVGEPRRSHSDVRRWSRLSRGAGEAKRAPGCPRHCGADF